MNGEAERRRGEAITGAETARAAETSAAGDETSAETESRRREPAATETLPGEEPAPGARTLTGAELSFLEAARRAVLGTIGAGGRPRLVPVCFAALDAAPGVVIVSPLDEKPKRVADVRQLARVQDILARPAVTLLVDRWDEDWSELAWLRLDLDARLLEPDAEPSLHRQAVVALRRKYPQYARHDLESRPMILMRIVAARSWGSPERGDGGSP